MTRYLLDVPSELWEKFKNTVPRETTLNDAIVELIKKKVAEG